MDRTDRTRRDFLSGAAALGAASLLGIPRPASAEPPPETTRFRIAQGPFLCYAPQMLAEELLRLDVCAADPERAARYLVEKGYEKRYEIGLEVVSELPYGRWRTDNPEDSLRFHALRLHEVGMLKSSPQKLISQGTDWRFLNELKRELKA